MHPSVNYCTALKNKLISLISATRLESPKQGISLEQLHFLFHRDSKLLTLQGFIKNNGKHICEVFKKTSACCLNEDYEKIKGRDWMEFKWK